MAAEIVDPSEVVVLSEVLEVYLPLQVRGVWPLSPFLVHVEFSHDLDPGFAANFDPSSYTISSPNLNVVGVTPGINQNEIFLQTDEQVQTVYLLTVNTAQSVPGDVIDLSANTMLFGGFGVQPAFFATAQSDRKVQLTFSTTITKNAAFLDTATYSVKAIDGTVIPITSVSSPTDINIPPSLQVKSRLVIELGTDLLKSNSYVVTTLSPLESTDGLTVFPVTDTFRWDKMLNTITVGISEFSGEVSGGILGTPAGLVYFSPALNVPFSGSSIQVDSVAVCTTAFDTYTVPSIPDPQAFMTFGGGITSLLNTTTDVLFATAERLGLFRYDLVDAQEDVWPGPAVDGPADATLVETINVDRASFLNVPFYKTFPGDPTEASLVSTFFDGVAEYVTIGDVAPLKFIHTDPFSIVFWFKSTDSGTTRIVSKRESAGNLRGYEILLSAGSVVFRRINADPGNLAAISATATNFNDGAWHQCIVTTDGAGVAGMFIYIDGAVVAVSTIEDTLAATIDITAPFQISGLDGANSLFNGVVDDVAVYDAALSAGQVITLFNTGSPGDLTTIGPTGDLVGLWLMGDGAAFPTIPDDSTNANAGTMVGMEASDFSGAVTGGIFRCADNLTVIGPGPTTNINLQP